MSDIQAKLLRQYNDQHREQFNMELFDRSDDDIIEELQKVILSCQRNKYFTIRVENFTVIDDYAEIRRLLREQQSVKSDSKDKSINKYDYITLKDSDIRLLIVDYYLKIPKPKMGKKGKLLRDEENLRVMIMVPRYVDKYYMRLLGNLYTMKYQIVDGSTYNNSQSSGKSKNVVLKTLFMATRIYRYQNSITCTDNTSISCIHYTSNIFSRTIPVMLYLLARYGLIDCCRKLMIQGLMLTATDPSDAEYYTIKKNDVYISIPRYIYDNDIVAQCLVNTIYLTTNKNSNVQMMYSVEHWCKVLGEHYITNGTADKGRSVLDSLEAIYDIPTRQALRLPEEHKKDIYDVLVWIVREFNELRKKDNLDIGAKRIRRPSEYIAALYAYRLSMGLYRIANDGENVQISTIEKSIYTFPDYLIKVITKDRLATSINAVNDMDAYHAIKCTYKGLSGLGEQKGSSIPAGYRQVHPSQLGRIDLDSSSANDPGMTGMLCPMTDLTDNYFSDFHEPNTWRDESFEVLKEYRRMQNLQNAFVFKTAIGAADPSDLSKIDSMQDEIQFTEGYVKPFVVGVDELRTIIDPLI